MATYCLIFQVMAVDTWQLALSRIADVKTTTLTNKTWHLVSHVLSKWTVWIKHFNLFLDSEFHQKANKFERTLGDIRLEKIISTPIWTIFLIFQLYSMLEIVPSCNLVQYKENWWCNFEKMAQILILDPIWSPNIFLTSFTSTSC